MPSLQNEGGVPQISKAHIGDRNASLDDHEYGVDYDSEIIKHDEQQQFLNDHHGSYYQEENLEIHQPIIEDHHAVEEGHHEVIEEHNEVIEDHHEVIDDHHEIIEEHHDDPHE